ncbi:MAG: O-methyltransferase, partial [Candidatus Paceibacterota bacterium]
MSRGINYYLRPNKQVERKIILDILQKCRRVVNMRKYCYLGMGSIYYYDFILMHKIFGIEKLISIDSKATKKRFLFNKPFNFIKFYNELSSKYLPKHDWDNLKSIIWLDYESKYKATNPVNVDLKIIGKNCQEKDFVFITVNAGAYKDVNSRRKFIEENKIFIPKGLQKLTYTSPKNFTLLIQNIMLNILADSSQYRKTKFHKIFSFSYQDGEPMYTLGGIFTKDKSLTKKLNKVHHLISTDKNNIYNIKIPNITYKEKHYLDENVKSLKGRLYYYKGRINKRTDLDDVEKHEKIK